MIQSAQLFGHYHNVNQLNFTFDGIATKAFQLIIIILWRF